MGIDSLLDGPEPDEFFDCTGEPLPLPPSSRTATELRSRLDLCATSLAEKIHRISYYHESADRHWLAELATDLEQIRALATKL